MPSAKKPIRFNAFIMNTVGHQSPGLWTHPEDLADALQSEAHAEHRPFAGEVGDDLVRQAGVVRAAGPGADEDAVGVERIDLVEGERVATMHERLGAELPEVLHEVVDERVVVVDHQHADHGTAR